MFKGMNRNRKGSALVVILIVVVILVIAGGIWYYYSTRQISVPVATNSNQISTSSPSLPALSFATLLPNSTCPQLTASLSNPPNVSNITQFFEPCAIPANIDANSFSIVGSGEFGTWAKDKNGVYFYQTQGGEESGGKIIEIQGADPATFVVVPSSSGLYYKDANYVYNFAIQNGANVVTTTPSVDAATFTGIGNGYFTDKNNVYYLDSYWNWSKLDGADPATFEYVGSYANPGGMSYAESVGKDKSCIYEGSNKIVNSSGACVDPTGCTTTSLVSNPSSCGLQ